MTDRQGGAARIRAGRQAWVHPIEDEMCHGVDLHASHFLRDLGEKMVATPEQNESLAKYIGAPDL
jgi:hypothetical protein